MQDEPVLRVGDFILEENYGLHLGRMLNPQERILVKKQFCKELQKERFYFIISEMMRR